MDEVVRIIQRAAARLFVDRLIRSLPVTIALALVALIIARLSQQLAAVAINWSVAWAIAGGAALLASILWALARSRDRAAVARLIDERADLRESLSTAMALADQRDPWSLAAVDQARERAQTVDLRRALPLTFPRRWPASVLAGLTLVIVWFAVPQADLFGRDRAAAAEQEEAEQLAQAQAETETIDKELKELLARLGQDEFAETKDAAAGAPEPSTPDAIRRAAIRKLTTVQDRLESLKTKDQSLLLESIKDQMRQLRQPGLGPVNEVVSAMQRGDFSRAAEKMSELIKDLASGKLPDEKKQELAQQLEQLARQMQELAQRRRDLENTLKQAGLDPNLANNPDALQKALEQAPGLSDEQKQQLLEQAQAAQGAADRMAQMAQALQQAAAQMGEGGDALQNMAQMGDMLSDLEMLAQEMKQINATQQFVWGKIKDLSQCLGDGEVSEFSPFQLWNDLNQGTNRGPGGGQFGDSDIATNTTRVKAPSKTTQGPIIGSTVVEGEQVRGESRAQFVELVEAGGQAASDAIESKAAPREYHDALKHYFGRLKAKAEAESAPEPATGQPE